jgi:ADP-ribosylglycohydrolase
MPSSNDLEKARGMLLGLAIGDALGAPTEFLSLDRIKERYGPQGIEDLPNPARYTDDTQMALAITEALVQAGDQDLETIMDAVKHHFIQWAHSPENNRAPGRTCLQGIARMEKGMHWTQSGIARSKGCGSAMRAAPIGYFYQHDPTKLRHVAHATGICTHGHPTADAACIGAAYLVKLALDRTPPRDMIPKLLAFTTGISSEFDEAVHKVPPCLDWEDEEQALDHLGQGWIGEEAVALALFCFLRHPDDYKKTVLRGANTNGDSDSIACIAGSISGAWLGVKAISEDWAQRIEKAGALNSLAERLERKQDELQRDGRHCASGTIPLSM